MEYLQVTIEYWSNIINLIGLGNLLIYIAGILWGLEMIPQLIKTYKTRNVKGISLAFFATSLSAYIIYAIGNVVLGNWNILIAHIPATLLTFWMVVLIFKYRRKNEKNTRKIKQH